jgi:monothiol glutaredoxin
MIPPSPPSLPHIASIQAEYEVALVQEVAKAVADNKVVVVGVAGLMPGKRARQMLDAKNVPHTYLEYGSYFSGWRRRLALKMWVKWPTFPHVFVNGTFVGGASDLKKLIASGEFDQLIAAPRKTS